MTLVDPAFIILFILIIDFMFFVNFFHIFVSICFGGTTLL